MLWLVSTCLLHGEVNLTWHDNSDNEDGFEIERSTNGLIFQKIASIPSNTTTYTDTNTQEGQLYFYRVRAFNKYGHSGYTNIAKFEPLKLISFEEWMALILGTTILPSSTFAPDQSLGQPDLTNLLCYVHGINPFEPDRSLLAKAKTVEINGRLTRTIERAVFKYSTGVETRLLASTDLKNWEPVEYESNFHHETSLHRWQQIVLPSQDQSVFYRLEYSLTPEISF